MSRSLMIEGDSFFKSIPFCMQDEKYHSKYGELLLEDVLRLKNLPGGAVGGDKQFERARKKLEQFLKSSTHYRASFLLSRIQNTDLYSEMAILYGRVSGLL